MTLEVFDETTKPSRATGSSATLDDAGNVTYEGTGAKTILAARIASKPAQEVFENMRNWSNGYISLKEKVA